MRDLTLTIVCLVVAFVIIGLMVALLLDDPETQIVTAPAPTLTDNPEQASDCELRYRRDGELHVYPMDCSRITLCQETTGNVPAPAYCNQPLVPEGAR